MNYANTAPAQVVTGNAWIYAPHHLKDADFGNEFGFHEPEGALDAPDMIPAGCACESRSEFTPVYQRLVFRGDTC